MAEIKLYRKDSPSGETISDSLAIQNNYECRRYGY